MAFYFVRGLCYRQDIAAVTSLGFVWNAWLSKRLFFFSLVFIRGASALRPDSWEEGLSSSPHVDTRLRLTFAASFLPDIYAGNPGLPESLVSLHRCQFTRLSFLCASILSLYSVVGLLRFGLLHNHIYYL